MVFFVYGLHRHAAGRLIEAFGVLPRTEQVDFAIGTAVRLCAFENFLGIM